MQDFINLKLHIESKSGITIEQIIAKLKYWKYKHNIQVAVIDFLQIIGIYRDWETDRKSTRLNSSHSAKSRMPSSA